MLNLISQEDLEHLFHNLPLASLWITAYGPLPENNQCFSHSPVALYSPAESGAQIDSSAWLTDSFPPLQVHRLATSHAAYVYVCTYRETPTPLGPHLIQSYLSGYWLLRAKAPLSALHCYCIEQQVKSFQMSQSALVVQSQLHRQIDSLKQTLYKTEHQLRTPLALVELYADVLQQSVSTHSLKAQAQHISQTVKEMMLSLKRLTRWDDIGQNKSVHMQYKQSDLRQLVANSIEELKPYWRQKALTVTGDGPSILLRVDDWQIKQAMLNLLNNAIAFSPNGSRITCRWQIHREAVLIDICDQGAGFSPEDLTHLFTPFYSKRHKGTGLGLIIARDIVQAHQGQLQARNGANGGAHLTISLPLKRSTQCSSQNSAELPHKYLAAVS